MFQPPVDEACEEGVEFEEESVEAEQTDRVDMAGDGGDGVDVGDEVVDGSAQGDSEDSSSSGSDSDVDEEAVAVALDKTHEAASSRKAPQQASTELFVHKRLGTLHKGKIADTSVLGCGRVLHSGYRKVEAPKFGWAKCKICFGA